MKFPCEWDILPSFLVFLPAGATIQTFDDFHLIPQLNLTADRTGRPICSSLSLCESDINVIQENGCVFVLSLTHSTWFVNIINRGALVAWPDYISRALPINQCYLIRFYKPALRLSLFMFHKWKASKDRKIKFRITRTSLCLPGPSWHIALVFKSCRSQKKILTGTCMYMISRKGWSK